LNRNIPGRKWLAALIVGSALLAPGFASERAFAFTQEQVASGAETFRLQCARCHGPSGQGIRDAYKDLTAPPLIGPESLPVAPRLYQKVRHYDFKNVRDVYEFASSVMPLDQPASLYANNYWDVLAYILNADGMPANGSLLDSDAAEKITIGNVHQYALYSRNPGQANTGSRGIVEEPHSIVGQKHDGVNPMQEGPGPVIVGESRNAGGPMQPGAPSPSISQSNPSQADSKK
jgi:mono/diheme cytochrome c family protein